MTGEPSPSKIFVLKAVKLMVTEIFMPNTGECHVNFHLK